MSEWKKYKLGDLCNRVCSGGTPSSRHSEYYDGNIPWLNTKEINFNRIYSTEKCISEDGLNNSAAKWIDENSVIVAMYGATAGKTAIAKIPLTTNQACCNLTINPSVADYQFVYYFLRYKFVELASLANGGAQQNLNAQIIKDFEILLPSLSEQKHIAKVLSSLDDKINDNLEQQAQAIFKSWFVDFEPFKNGEFIDSELGRIPKGWTIKELGQVTISQNEKVKKRQNVKVFSPVTSGELVLSEEYFTKRVYSENVEKYILVRPNEFAYNPARVNIGSIGMNTYGFDGCVSPVYVVFKCEEGYQFFFDMFRQTSFFKEEVKTRAIGGVRQTLGYKDFAMIKIVYPPKDIIEAFNDIYTKLLLKKYKNSEENKHLASVQDIILPKLMSGELKVSEINM